MKYFSSWYYWYRNTLSSEAFNFISYSSKFDFIFHVEWFVKQIFGTATLTEIQITLYYSNGGQS